MRTALKIHHVRVEISFVFKYTLWNSLVLTAGIFWNSAVEIREFSRFLLTFLMAHLLFFVL